MTNFGPNYSILIRCFLCIPFRLVEGCPLASLRESAAADNPHVANLSTSINGPLYMESKSGLRIVAIVMTMLIPLYIGVLGHPFGRVPTPKPFDGNLKEAEVILSDPANPIGKDLIAGKYKVYMYIYNYGSELCTGWITSYSKIHDSCMTAFPYQPAPNSSSMCTHTLSHTH